MQWYRDNFQPSEYLSEPLVNVGVSAVCAETPEQAKQLGSARRYMRLRRDQGQSLSGVPSEDELAGLNLNEAEQRLMDLHAERAIEGDPAHVKERLEQLAAAYSTDELIVLTITPSYKSRARSYELLAHAFGLEGQG